MIRATFHTVWHVVKKLNTTRDMFTTRLTYFLIDQNHAIIIKSQSTECGVIW